MTVAVADSLLDNLHALATGDHRAWETLAEREGPALWQTCYAVLGRHDQADDAYQEALVAIARGARGFRGRTPVQARAWLHRVAGNAARQWLRSQSRRRQHEHRDPPPADQVDQDDPLARQETDALLHRAISTLSERHRQVVVRHFFGGLDHAALAAELGTSSGNTRVLLHRSLQALRQQLGRIGLAIGLAALGQRLTAAGSHAVAPVLLRPTATAFAPSKTWSTLMPMVMPPDANSSPLFSPICGSPCRPNAPAAPSSLRSGGHRSRMMRSCSALLPITRPDQVSGTSFSQTTASSATSGSNGASTACWPAGACPIHGTGPVWKHRPGLSRCLNETAHWRHSSGNA